ncbi:hypothetical protein QOZ80_5BG0454480 [Eleusine coracana subsp. coracana]|nr:hypothetical protein QOZ80_5BG0454480 [Eleusine coracana subsp. coracana]
MAPELVDDILFEILLRLPPDDPACLLRASLACKRWRRLLADPCFRRRHRHRHRHRHREIHRIPTVVGFLRIMKSNFPFASRFVPNGPASGRPAARELPGWLPLDCRHGRALFVAPAPDAGPGEIMDFVVWNPLTDERRRLPPPSPPPSYNHMWSFNAAVLCAAAAEGCDHRDCHRGPFLAVFIWSNIRTSACLYSSVTDNWSEVTSVQQPDDLVEAHPRPGALVGGKIYFRGHTSHTLEYQLDTQRLEIIKRPPHHMRHGSFPFLMSREDRGVEFAAVEHEPSVRHSAYDFCRWR